MKWYCLLSLIAGCVFSSLSARMDPLADARERVESFVNDAHGAPDPEQAAPQFPQIVIIVPVHFDAHQHLVHIINHQGNHDHVVAYQTVMANEDLEASLDAMEVLLEANNFHPVWREIGNHLATAQDDVNPLAPPFIRLFLAGLVRRALEDNTGLYARYEFNLEVLLYYAVWLQDVALVRLTLERGANPNALRSRAFNLGAVPEARVPGLALGLPAIIARLALRYNNFMNPMNFNGPYTEAGILPFAILFGCNWDILAQLIDAGATITYGMFRLFDYHTFDDGEEFLTIDTDTPFARRIERTLYNQSYWRLWWTYLRARGHSLLESFRLALGALEYADVPRRLFFPYNNSFY